MATGWAWGKCGPDAGAQGCTGSLQYHTGSGGISGSCNLVFYTGSVPYILELTGNLNVSGTITAINYDVVNHTVTYFSSSGDSKFGDSLDDVHQFTGSIQQTGSGTTTYFMDRVGIGTTTPTAMLEVTGASGSSDDNYPIARFKNSNYYCEVILDAGAGYDARIGYYEAGVKKWDLGNDENPEEFRLRNADGNKFLHVTQEGLWTMSSSVVITDDLTVCNGTASILHLSGCSPIQVHAPMQIQSGYSLSFNGASNTAKITNNGSNLDFNSPGSIVLNSGNNNVSSSAAVTASAFIFGPGGRQQISDTGTDMSILAASTGMFISADGGNLTLQGQVAIDTAGALTASAGFKLDANPSLTNPNMWISSSNPSFGPGYSYGTMFIGSGSIDGQGQFTGASTSLTNFGFGTVLAIRSRAGGALIRSDAGDTTIKATAGEVILSGSDGVIFHTQGTFNNATAQFNAGLTVSNTVATIMANSSLQNNGVSTFNDTVTFNNSASQHNAGLTVNNTVATINSSLQNNGVSTFNNTATFNNSASVHNQGINVNNARGTFNSGLTVNNASAIFNDSVTLGDSSGDGVTWNAGSWNMSANSVVTTLKDGVDGLSGTGALMFFTGSGGDFMKFHTSGSAKGIYFGQQTYLSQGGGLSGTLAGPGSFLAINSNNMVVLATPPAGGGSDCCVFREIDASNAYSTSSISIGTSGTPAATLHVSSSNNEVAFRVDNAQSNTLGPALFITGSRASDGAARQSVGIGTSTPRYALDVQGYMSIGKAGTAYIFNNNDENTYIKFGGSGIPGVDGQQFVCGGKVMLTLDENSLDTVTIGTSSTATDFKVATLGNDYTLYVSGGVDRVGIGTASPKIVLDIHHSGAANIIKPDGTSILAAKSGGGEVVYYGTGSALSSGSVYYLNEDGGWAQAQATDVSMATGQLGISLGTNAASDGMLIRGFANIDTFFEGTIKAGKVLYVSHLNPGYMSHTAPTGSGEILRLVGHATSGSSNVIHFNPEVGWLELV